MNTLKRFENRVAAITAGEGKNAGEINGRSYLLDRIVADLRREVEAELRKEFQTELTEAQNATRTVQFKLDKAEGELARLRGTIEQQKIEHGGEVERLKNAVTEAQENARAAQANARKAQADALDDKHARLVAETKADSMRELHDTAQRLLKEMRASPPATAFPPTQKSMAPKGYTFNVQRRGDGLITSVTATPST
jgi:hypothetical protein